MAPSSDDFRCTTKNGWRCFLVPKFHGLKGLMMMMIWKYITCQHSFWHQFCNNFAFQLTSAIAPQSLPTRVFSVMLIFYKWYHPRDIFSRTSLKFAASGRPINIRLSSSNSTEVFDALRPENWLRKHRDFQEHTDTKMTWRDGVGSFLVQMQNCLLILL